MWHQNRYRLVEKRFEGEPSNCGMSQTPVATRLHPHDALRDCCVWVGQLRLQWMMEDNNFPPPPPSCLCLFISRCESRVDRCEEGCVTCSSRLTILVWFEAIWSDLCENLEMARVCVKVSAVASVRSHTAQSFSDTYRLIWQDLFVNKKNRKCS